MCRFWSAILFEDGTVVYDPGTNSHEDLLCIAMERGLHATDSSLVNRKFVRVEITPQGSSLDMSRDYWNYHLDEAGTLPEWYAQDTLRQERIVWAAWEEAMKKMLGPLNWDALKEATGVVEHIKRIDAHDHPRPEWILFANPDVDIAKKEAIRQILNTEGDGASLLPRALRDINGKVEKRLEERLLANTVLYHILDKVCTLWVKCVNDAGRISMSQGAQTFLYSHMLMALYSGSYSDALDDEVIREAWKKLEAVLDTFLRGYGCAGFIGEKVVAYGPGVKEGEPNEL